jgi:hypothetical protein
MLRSSLTEQDSRGKSTAFVLPAIQPTKDLLRSLSAVVLFTDKAAISLAATLANIRAVAAVSVQAVQTYVPTKTLLLRRFSAQKHLSAPN